MCTVTIPNIDAKINREKVSCLVVMLSKIQAICAAHELKITPGKISPVRCVFRDKK